MPTNPPDAIRGRAGRQGVMPRNYFPSREAELKNWVMNLNDKVSADAAGYGLTVEQATALGSAVGDFEVAYATATNPSTRTGPSIAAKKTAKKDMLAAIRPLVQTMQNWSGMTDEKRDLLGIPVRDVKPTPIGPPEEMPVLRVGSVVGRTLNLEVRRTDGKTRRKPSGVRAVWLRTYVGVTPPQVLGAYEFRGESTKSNPQVVFEPGVAPGTPVWVTAMWVNPTGVPGPACAPVKTHISFMGLDESA